MGNNCTEDFNYLEIYGNVTALDTNRISIVHINEHTESRRVCIFGILDSEMGRKIKDEMLSWLTLEYDVYCVIQKEPGELYEYPALRFAQWLCETKNVDYLLYVHTKGAVFKNPTQKKIRQLWKHEFTGKRADEYVEYIMNDNYDVVCPLTGTNNQTWYNGMFVSKRAFSNIPEIKPSKDRYSYQRLFSSSSKIKGLLGYHISSDRLTEYTLTLFNKYIETLSIDSNDVIFHIKY